jgi:hypothetical protein
MKFIWKKKEGALKYRLVFKNAKTNSIIFTKEIIGQTEFDITEELKQYGDDLLLMVEYFNEDINKYACWFPYFHLLHGIKKTKLKIKPSIDSDGFPLRLILKDINKKVVTNGKIQI